MGFERTFASDMERDSRRLGRTGLGHFGSLIVFKTKP
jgi:hypothetical protein